MILTRIFGVRIFEQSCFYIGPEAPQESILYSLVAGRTELIMFGGLRKDISVGGNSRQETPTLSRLNLDSER